ncbi:hypothetical protein D3C78_1962810 [compost metagenome]
MQHVTAGYALQTFSTGDGEIRLHFGPLRLAGQRPHIDLAIEWVAQSKLFERAL